MFAVHAVEPGRATMLWRAGSIGLLLALTGVMLLCPLSPLGNAARAAEEPAIDYSELSLTDLINLEITSVSRKPEPLSDAHTQTAPLSLATVD